MIPPTITAPAAPVTATATTSAQLPDSWWPTAITNDSSLHLEKADNFRAIDMFVVLARLLLSYIVGLYAWRLRQCAMVLFSQEVRIATVRWLSKIGCTLRTATHQAEGDAGHAASRDSTENTPSCSPSLSENRGTLRTAEHQAEGDAAHGAARENSTEKTSYNPLGSLFEPALSKVDLVSLVREVITPSEVCVRAFLGSWVVLLFLWFLFDGTYYLYSKIDNVSDINNQ